MSDAFNKNFAKDPVAEAWQGAKIEQPTVPTLTDEAQAAQDREALALVVDRRARRLVWGILAFVALLLGLAVLCTGCLSQ